MFGGTGSLVRRSDPPTDPLVPAGRREWSQFMADGSNTGESFLSGPEADDLGDATADDVEVPGVYERFTTNIASVRGAPPTVAGDRVYLSNGVVNINDGGDVGDIAPGDYQPAVYEDRVFGTFGQTLRAHRESGGGFELDWERRRSESGPSGPRPPRPPTVTETSSGPLVVVPSLGAGQIQAYGVDGTQRWSTGDPPVGSPLAASADGTLVFTAGARGTRMAALDTDDGSMVWTTSLPADSRMVRTRNSGFGDAAPTFAPPAAVDGDTDGLVLKTVPQAPDGDGRIPVDFQEATTDLYALDPGSGEIVWQTTFNEAFSHPPAVGDGRAYLLAEQAQANAPPTLAWGVNLSTAGYNQAWHRTIPRPDDAPAGYGANHEGTRRFDSWAPTVAGGVVYLADIYGVLRALDAETGDERWAHAGREWLAEPPTVVEDNLIHRTGEGLTCLWDGGLDISVPEEVTALSGLAGDIPVAVQNDSPEEINGIDVTADLLGSGTTGPDGEPHLSEFTSVAGADTPADRIEGEIDTAERFGLDPESVVDLEPGGSLDPGETGVLEVRFEVGPRAAHTYAVDLEVEASDAEPQRDIATVAVEKTVEIETDLPVWSQPMEAGEQETVFTIEVWCNDRIDVSDVAVVPEFEAIEGDWAVVTDGVAPGGDGEVAGPPPRDPAGGEWDVFTWSIDALSAGESRSPRLRMSVPENALTGDTQEGNVRLPLSAYINGEGGDRGTLVNTHRRTRLELIERRLKPYLIGPEEAVGLDETTTLDAFIAAEDDPLRDVAFEFSIPPGFEPAEEASEPDGGTFSFEDDRIRYEIPDLPAGTADAPTVGVRSPTREEADDLIDEGRTALGDRTLGVTARGEATFGDGATENAEANGRITFSEAAVLTINKQRLAERIDDLSLSPLQDESTVMPQVDELEAQSGDLPGDVAANAIDRGLMAEEILNRQLEIVVRPRDGSIWGTSRRTYAMARTVVRNIVTAITGIGFLGKLVKLLGRAFLRVGGSAAKAAWEGASNFVLSGIEDIIGWFIGYTIGQIQTGTELGSQVEERRSNLTGGATRRAGEEVESLTGGDVSQSTVSTSLDALLVVGNPLAAQTAFVRLLERGYEQISPAQQVRNVADALAFEEVQGGLGGSQPRARQNWSTAIGRFDQTAGRVDDLISEMNESIPDILLDAAGSIADAISAIAQAETVDALWSAGEVVFDVARTIVNFLISGILPALTAGGALISFAEGGLDWVSHTLEGTSNVDFITPGRSDIAGSYTGVGGSGR